jgi:hypothetical protein
LLTLPRFAMAFSHSPRRRRRSLLGAAVASKAFRNR